MDILISDPEILSPKKGDKKKANHLYIPKRYIDKLNSFYEENSTRGDSARQVIAVIGMMLEYINYSSNDYFICGNGMKVEFTEDISGSNSATTNAILLAKQLQQSQRGQVAIMTGSDPMIAKAAAEKIDIAHVNPEIYDGRRSVQLPSDAVSLWEKNKAITAEEWNDIFGKRQAPLRANEFIELNYAYTGQSKGFKNIGRFDANAGTKGVLRPLRYTKFRSQAYRNVRPLTPLQAMFMEALLAPADEIPIVIVSGVFGLGKTFLAMAAGLNGVGYRNSNPNLELERIFISPRDSNLGRDIGFLPGGQTDKVIPKAMPIIDNFRAILKLLDSENSSELEEIMQKPQNGKKKRRKSKDKVTYAPFKNINVDSEIQSIINRYCEFVPMAEMGGRSIESSLIYYDEFQDVERFQARELISRIGNGSKIIITGDPSQRSNPHVNRTSNGLNYVATRLADKPFAAVLSSYDQGEIVRHWVLGEIAKAFGTHH